MRVLFNADVYGWRMTGLLGRYGAWFFGFSRRPWDSSHTNPMPEPPK